MALARVYIEKSNASSRMDPAIFFISAGCGGLVLAAAFEAADQS
jgi:hypothetical protein